MRDQDLYSKPLDIGRPFPSLLSLKELGPKFDVDWYISYRFSHLQPLTNFLEMPNLTQMIQAAPTIKKKRRRPPKSLRKRRRQASRFRKNKPSWMPKSDKESSWRSRSRPSKPPLTKRKRKQSSKKRSGQPKKPKMHKTE